MKRRFIRQVIIYALLYCLMVFLLNGVIFLLSHVPPQAVNLDGLILRLGEVEQFLAWPRLVLRRLWPNETTPANFNYILPGLNCLIWGLALTGFKTLWIQARK